MTAPNAKRATSNPPNELAVALQIIAAPQVTVAMASIGVRWTRSASTPKGNENSAATADDTATSSPMSVLSILSACRRATAEAPTVALSALDRASTQARTTITLTRSGPPKE